MFPVSTNHNVKERSSDLILPFQTQKTREVAAGYFKMVV